MDGVGAVLVRLQPVARRVDLVRDQPVRLRILVPAVVYREGRRFLRRPHVGEDEPPVLLRAVSAVAKRVLERTARRLARRFKHGSVYVVEPAVVATADPALGNDAEL